MPKRKGWFSKAKKKLKNNPERMAKHRVESLNGKLKRDKPFKD
jgi:hypothetical protein